MKLLAVDTSTRACSVAVVDQDRLACEITTGPAGTHSSQLLSLIRTALALAEMELHGLDGLAVCVGPGSFTGLRIGVSTVKGLAFATAKPVAGVSSLEALAQPCLPWPHLICAMLDARKGEVYAAVFRWEHDGFVPVVSVRSIRPEELVRDCTGPVVLAGEGVLRYRDKILSAAAEVAIIAPSQKMVPSPSNVALLGLQKALRSEFADAATAEPLYIRKSEAEVQWSEKQ